MAKVTYEFDLYEDAEDIRLFQAARDMYLALHDIYKLVRSHEKWGDDTSIEAKDKLLDEIREKTSIVWGIE